MGIKGTYLNIIKGMYNKPIANILNGETLKALPIRSGTRKECLLMSLIFNIVWNSWLQQSEKRKK